MRSPYVARSRPVSFMYLNRCFIVFGELSRYLHAVESTSDFFFMILTI